MPRLPRSIGVTGRLLLAGAGRVGGVAWMGWLSQSAAAHGAGVAGCGVLFFDADGRNAITGKPRHVFTEWRERRHRHGPVDRFRQRTREAPRAAPGDMEALRSVFDTNGDGKLTAADADFAKFKVLMTNADGSTTVRTLTSLGITVINLTTDTTNIVLPEGLGDGGQLRFEQDRKGPARWHGPNSGDNALLTWAGE